MQSLRDQHIGTLVVRCSKIKVLDLRHTEVGNSSLAYIMNQLKDTLEEVDVSLTGINFDKLLELKTMTKLKILTCLHLNCQEFNVLKNILPRILINEELFSVIGGPNEFNQFSIWEVKADQTDLFEDNEQF